MHGLAAGCFGRGAVGKCNGDREYNSEAGECILAVSLRIVVVKGAFAGCPEIVQFLLVGYGDDLAVLVDDRDGEYKLDMDLSAVQTVLSTVVVAVVASALVTATAVVGEVLVQYGLHFFVGVHRYRGAVGQLEGYREYQLKTTQPAGAASLLDGVNGLIYILCYAFFGQRGIVLCACVENRHTCKKGEQMKGKMFVLCLRYANTREDAEDMLQEGFVRVFRDLHQYSGAGNFEGWVRKVIVNTALQHLKRHLREPIIVELGEYDAATEAEPFQNDALPAQNLIKILQQLPAGFRTVFNLYVLEGYSHPEIAEILNISVGTSKSQLLRAKAHFRALLEGSLTT